MDLADSTYEPSLVAFPCFVVRYNSAEFDGLALIPGAR